MSKLAIIQCADSGPLESLVCMLESVGYECRIPNADLRRELRNAFAGKGLVLSPRDLTRSMGYDPVSVPEVGHEAMATASVYADVKAHQVYDAVVKRWPNLNKRVLWYRINGARPEHVVNARGDHGDEMSPPCPIITPNMWYERDNLYSEADCTRCAGSGAEPNPSPDVDLCMNCDHCWGMSKEPYPWRDYSAENAYAMWPPFCRLHEYDPAKRPHLRPPVGVYDAPICLIHNATGWGYQDLIPNMRELNVHVFGTGSPDGLLKHQVIAGMLAGCLAMVHLKSSDAPGYAIYECLAAGCPLICTRRLIWRCRMQDLLEPGVTCLVFDRETHDGLTEQDVRECTAEVAGHLERLRDPDFNRKIGEAGRDRLRKIMWSAERSEDAASLRAFMTKHFGE